MTRFSYEAPYHSISLCCVYTLFKNSAQINKNGRLYLSVHLHGELMKLLNNRFQQNLELGIYIKRRCINLILASNGQI